ncbi:hypothetical protein MP228_001569 [Amoeboaphelidium protococcarum]|nr:hypothetical protein MP228_001569 [Amoeboaphelidium protococcarum]
MSEIETEEEEFASASEGEDFIDNSELPSATNVLDQRQERPEDDPTIVHGTQSSESHQHEQNAPSLVDEVDQSSYIKEQQSEKQYQQEQPSAGGWSSWLTSAISAVQESLQDDLNDLSETAKDIGGKVTKVSDVVGSKVYTTLDGGQKVDFRVADDQSVGGGAGGDNVDGGDGQQVITSPNGSIMKGTEVVIKGLDSAMDFTSDLLGNAVLTSIKKLNEVQIQDKLKDGQVVGQVLFQNGVGALEAIGSIIGSKTANLLAEKRNQQKEKSMQQNKLKGRRVPRIATVHDYFDDNCGLAHMQALEMLSEEAKSKTLVIQDVDTSLVDQLLSQEKLQDGCSNLVIDSEHFDQASAFASEARDLLQNVGVGNFTQVDDMDKYQSTLQIKIQQKFEQYQAQMDKVNDQDAQGEERDNATDNFTRQYQSLCAQSLADIAEMSCEQILRLAEIFLMSIAEQQMKAGEQSTSDRADNVEKLCQNVEKLVVQMVKLLAACASLLNQSRSQFIEYAISHNVQCSKLQNSEKQIQIDFEICKSWVIDSALCLTSILKLMMAIK